MSISSNWYDESACVFTTGSRSTSPAEQLYMLDEDLPSLTWTQPQEVKQGPVVPVQHTSSKDLGDSATLSTTSASNSTTTPKLSPPTQQLAAIQSAAGLVDACYSSSVHQLPQDSLSLPQISDLTLGTSAPELTSIAQQHMSDYDDGIAQEHENMIDGYDEGTVSVSDSDSGAHPTHAKKDREIKSRTTSQTIGKCVGYMTNALSLCPQNGMNDILLL